MKTILAIITLTGAGLLILAGTVPGQEKARVPDAVQGAKGLEDALRNLNARFSGTPSLPASESLRRFKVADGLAVDLIASEPVVRQPVYVTFDERGRMWVVQYNQYPLPAGLKVVSYDQYIRAQFDKVPPAPPNHVRGRDKVTIHEDVGGDGTFKKVTTFLEGTNITTAALPGRGGVWVLNPPYLLFYPDRDRDDVPDGPPVVHLSGFGLEDTHSVANSLCWGPDGWIYGAHGSTVTAKVRAHLSGSDRTTDFLGQGIWRYHPEEHRFELFAEGGGNTFGVTFDDQGRLYSGTNGDKRGVYYVQGGYYLKAWGKHGPLTNPYALGFFEFLPTSGNSERFTHNFLIYGGGALPESFTGKLIAPNPYQRRVQVARLEPLGSSYRALEEPFLLTTTDGWFRPIDLKAGPDGALYLTDFYESRITHLDPRDTWDRSTGRVYRIRAREYRPAGSFDFAARPSADLVAELGHKNRWVRHTALRVLGDRKDRSALGKLREQIDQNTGQLALESLWALHLCGGLNDDFALKALDHADPFVRLWTVRLLGDRKHVSPPVSAKLVALAAREPHAQVRSQLASTAKRLPGPAALPLVQALLQRTEDGSDPHVPLLLWWAVESKAESDREAVAAWFRDPAFWRLPLVERFVVERLAQRYGLAGGSDNLLACARLLRLAPDREQANQLLIGLEKAFAGRDASGLPRELHEAVAQAWASGATASRLALGLRIGHAEAVAGALKVVADNKADAATRLELVRILGEVNQPGCVPVLLDLLGSGAPAPLRREALNALQRYDDPRIGDRVLSLHPGRMPDDPVRQGAFALLASRPAWAGQLLRAVDAGTIPPRVVPLEAVQRLALHADKQVAALVQKHWGRVRATPAEKQREVTRLAGLLRPGKGDAAAGKAVFANTCGKCHKLFGEGADVGPDLTGYERDKVMYWLENIVDPSAVIREEYTTFIVQATDGRLLTGVVAAQDRGAVTLRGADGQTVRVAREKIEEMKASPQSLMPEDQLKGLTDAQIRDLLAYLMRTQ